MNELLNDPRAAMLAGALLGVILQASRMRDAAKFIPATALLFIALSVFASIPIPAPALYALVGCGAVIAVVRLVGGR